MGALGAINTAISGLEANSQHLSVISDNIVNANTTGFKSSRSEFQDMFALTLGGDHNASHPIGRGVQIGGVTGQFTQGSISRTERTTDLAIKGDGFFVLNNHQGMRTYTRDGSFRFDKDGYLTSVTGEKVQVFQAGADGAITARMGDVRIPSATVPAKETANIVIHANLDARQAAGKGINLLKPEETAHFTTATQIYDSIGNGRPVNVFFHKVDDGSWTWHAMTDGANLAGEETGEKILMAEGELKFDERGRLESVRQNIVNSSFADGAIANQDLVFDFGDMASEGGTGERGSTQFGSKSAIFRGTQDGYASGTLIDTVIDSEGLVRGVYSNGEARNLGQLMMGRFEATERLARLGSNQFSETVSSGNSMIGKANTNGMGGIESGSLEGSNVDLAKEFVDMVQAQRGFQASAKSIHTANQMLDEIIQIAGR